jgi:hypothetical protein
VVWTGPSAGCDLSGTWASTGFGDDEAAARDAALDRLRKALLAGVEATSRAAEVRGGTSLSADACPQAAAALARFTCFSEPTLRESRLCFADLPDGDCWSADPIVLEGTAWREMDRGRDQVCRQAEDALRASNASAVQVATCNARCWQLARVRCPPGPSDEPTAYAGRPYFLTEKAAGGP